MGARRQTDCAPTGSADQAADRAATNQRTDPADGCATDEGVIADNGADPRTVKNPMADGAAYKDFSTNVVANNAKRPTDAKRRVWADTVADISGYSNERSNRINNNRCSGGHAFHSK